MFLLTSGCKERMRRVGERLIKLNLLYICALCTCYKLPKLNSVYDEIQFYDDSVVHVLNSFVYIVYRTYQTI